MLLSAGMPASLLKQINTAMHDASPSDFAVSGGELCFVADDGVHWRQVWKSDGTAAGTTMVSDFPNAEFDTLHDLIDVNGTLDYFDDSYEARAGYSQSTLFRSDGTTAGAALGNFVNGEMLTNVNGTAYFFAAPPGQFPAPNLDVVELYKTDGTAAGTVPVAQVAPSFGPNVGSAMGFDGELFFTVGNDLWKSDGTSAGTVQVATIGTANSATIAAGANGRLFIVSGSLWVSDGTAAGTSRISDNPIVGTAVAAFGQDVYFTAFDSNQQPGIWKTDGTPAGTSLVSYLPAGSLYSPSAAFIVVNNILYFDLGTELWRTDGSSQATVDASSVFGAGVTFTNNGAINGATYNGKFYFNGAEGVLGQQLWVTDGTPAGTYQVAQINATPRFTTLSGNAVPIGGETYFRAGGAGVWRTDGTAAGTVQLSVASVSGNLVNADGTLYFVSDADQLWKSDGTPAGTVMVAQLPNGPQAPKTTLTAMGSDVYFYAAEKLYRSDGTAAGTVAVAPAADSLPGSYDIYSMADVNGTLFFTATVNGNMELDKIDPSRGAAVRVMTFNGMPPQASELTAVDGQLYFIADDGAHGPALWEDTPITAPVIVYATKPEGTSDYAGSVGTVLYEFNHALYFSEPALGPGLFTVDPATLRVSKVSDQTAVNMIAVGNRLYFQSNATPSNLWVTDAHPGTGDNATQVAGVTMPLGSTFADASQTAPQWTSSNGVLYFLGNSPSNVQQLWQANGADATLADPTEPAGGWTVDGVLAQTPNGVVFFGRNGSQNAPQLWEFPAQAAPPAPPAPPSAVLPTLGRVNLPPQAVAGAKFTATVPVVVTNSGTALNGLVTVNLYAETGMTLDGTQVLVASETRHVSLKAHQRVSFPFNLKSLPAFLKDGTYRLVAQVIDPTGDTNSVATSKTVQVSARSVHTSVALRPIVPATLGTNGRGSAVVTVTNHGNAPAFVGRITLSLSSNGSNAVPFTLTTVYEDMDVAVGKSRRFRLPFKLYGATGGSYVPSAAVSLDVLTTVTSDSPVQIIESS